MAVSDAENLKTTPLYDRHVAAGGRMVPFGGYSLPVQYPAGIMAEHKWTREHAGLFDVSHMGPSLLMPLPGSATISYGDDGKINMRMMPTFSSQGVEYAALAQLVEPLICGDLQSLPEGKLRYTLLLNQNGGAIDDLMVGRAIGGLYITVNAGTKDNDFRLIKEAVGNNARLRRLDDHALLALQGPEAIDVLGALLAPADLTAMDFMSFDAFAWRDTIVTVSRSGYTGEDGFEILVPPTHAEAFWDALLTDERCKPVGLGARDSLRLEAGLPLYGHDLDETVSPIEAGLGFAVSKCRREAADFPGASRILAERDGALNRVRVGLIVEGAPAREGAEILDASGAAIGVVTSGGFAPSLGKAIALGFVPPAQADIGTRLQVSVRGRAQAAEVVQTPFVPHRYFRKAKI